MNAGSRWSEWGERSSAPADGPHRDFWTDVVIVPCEIFIFKYWGYESNFIKHPAVWTPMFIAVLLIVAKNEKQPKCLSSDE